MRTSDRPLVYRRRPDLRITPQRYGGERYWIVSDPASLRHTRLRHDEYALFECLDGEHGLDDLIAFYEAKFAPRRLSSDELARFVTSLRSSGLLLTEQMGQAQAAYERSAAQSRSMQWRRWTNPLAVRFRGLDPTAMFDRLYPLVRPLLSRTATIIGGLIILSAALLAAVQWRKLELHTADFHAYFTPTNLLLLIGVLSVTKILHEFGHGLVCRHFGGRTHELGMMLLIFTPSLYCNVSDAWRFPNKWHRAAVGAAGIYVELLLASAATFLWHFSEPGLLHQICFGIMAVCSISTVLFNGNPLLRYDGYYVLSDLVEVPNLSERAGRVVRNAIARLFIKEDPDESDPLVPQHGRGWYAAYAILSTAYRLSVTVAIVFLLVALARPYRLEILARGVGVLAIVSTVAGPLRRFGQFLREHGRNDNLNRRRLWWSSAAGLGLIIAFFYLPLPYHILGPFELRPYRAERVFVEVPGRYDAVAVSYGQRLRPNEEIVRLVNRDLDLEVEKLTTERALRIAQLAALRRERFERPSAAAAIPQAEKLLEAVEAQLATARNDRDRLTLRTARGGVFYPPQLGTAPNDGDELPTWSGRPLDAVNRGCTFATGTLLGEVGDPTAWEAWVIVDQNDIEVICLGDRVELLLDALTEVRLQGTVDEISVGELAEPPSRLSSRHGGELAVTTDDARRVRAISTSYSVRVRLSDDAGAYRVGWRGTARISPVAVPPATRFGRWAARTFHFHW